MKKIFLAILLVATSISSYAQNYFKVGSFNVRYDSSRDRANGDGWEVRSKEMFDFLNYERWEIFGAQEVLHNQLQDLLSNLDNYDYIGVGRNDGAQKGEYAPIFYRKDRMKCLDKGWFWISETPDVVASKGWDANQCRICTWGKFEDKTSKWQFYFFNVHMDHRGVVARREGSKLILAKMKEMCGDLPYILTGDFNVDQNNEIFEIFTKSGMLVDTYASAKHRMVPNGTVNRFKIDFGTESRIDHILVSPHFKTYEYGVLTNNWWSPIEVTEEMKVQIAAGAEDVVCYKARVISDHYPVVARVELPLLRSPQDWAQYARYEEKNKGVTKKPSVVFMGDSITDGWYRYDPDFFNDNNYLGRGISGQVTAQMLARFRSDVLNFKPKKVVILAGTNDIAMNQGYMSLDHIFENIVSMAELARANKIKVVLCSVLPANKYRWSWEMTPEKIIDSIRELNKKIEAYAKANGHKYADYYSVMVDENYGLIKEYQNDAVHPNLEGYKVMEEVIQNILK